ncbi:MAG: KamA family radical SAM protein [Sedimentisphaerales bacterium]|nr:KamA family radical SAM protein [Sedimentisphaerales bacterium]
MRENIHNVNILQDSQKPLNRVGKLKYITKIEQLPQLSGRQADRLHKVTEQFAFRSNDYYLSLIDWDDPNDPIGRIIVPNIQELEPWGRLDPSGEISYTIIEGLEHKYSSTVLLLVSNVCDGICRYCFRKRVFIKSQRELLRDLDAAILYIQQHDEITNILLTGGDPLVLTTSKLENIIRRVREILHVQIIRIGTKIPAFNPYRIVDDAELLRVISKYSTDRKRIYFMTHFIHPRELTDVAVKAVSLLQSSGAKIANQMPLISGVNDDPEVLAELLAQLSFIGAAPYYIFQCRPALGNKAYTVPVERAYEIIEQAKAKVSGLAKRVLFVMSHSSGKIEIVGLSQKYVYFKYHRAACDEDSGRFLAFRRKPDACWFDDYDEVIRDYPIELPYRSYGPQ